MTSYDNTPGAGAEPGLLAPTSATLPLLCTGTEQTAPAQPAETPAGSAGHSGRLAGSSCTALLESKHGCRPISPAKTHLIRPLKPVTKTKHDKSCNK